MSNFWKFKGYRIDLDKIIAYQTYSPIERKSRNFYKIYFYPQDNHESYFEIYYDSIDDKDKELFEDTIKMLDDYFDVKTSDELKLLP